MTDNITLSSREPNSQIIGAREPDSQSSHIYKSWLRRMALKFLEHPDNEVIFFLEDERNNLIPSMIILYGIDKVVDDLTETILSLR